MSNVTEALNSLTPEQRALLELKLKQKRKQAVPLQGISTRPDPNHYPLSAGQLRLWDFVQLAPESTLYTIADAVHLRGELNWRNLEASINCIIARHESLRARFDELNGEPLQFVDSFTPIQLPLTLVEGENLHERQYKVAGLLRQEVARPFDLAQGPLIRVNLYQLAADAHVLAVTMHHIIADGWSFNLFMHELATFYRAFTTQREPTLSTLPIQYADYAYWQQRWLKSESAQQQLTYWEEELKGAEPLQLPVDLAPPQQRTQRGASRACTLSAPLTEKLKSLSRKENTTLFVTLFAAFNVLLNRTTGQTDLIVASPTVGRIRPELEELIGYFNNIVVLRTKLSAEVTLAELMRHIHQTTVRAYDNQELPFQTVANSAKLRHIPLARALFTLQDSVENILDFPGVDATTLAVENDTADFDLFLFVEQKPETLVFDLRYKVELFSASQIDQFLANLETTLELMTVDASQTLGALPTFTLTSRMGNKGAHPQPETVDGNGVYKAATPTSKLELQLVQIWERVLNRTSIGLTDDFFESGGHSLLALQMFAAIEQEITGVKLPLALLLKAPTVAKLADALRTQGVATSWSPLTVIKSGAPGRRALFLVHAAGGNVLVYRDLAHKLDADQPVYGLQAQGLDGDQPLLSSVEEMAALYIREIQSVQPHGPYLLGGYCMGGTIALEIAQQLKAQGEEVALLTLFETYNWSRIGAESHFDKLYFWVQKIEFHIRNFLLLNRTQKRTFFHEKLEALKSRSHIWRGVLRTKFGGDTDSTSQHDIAMAELWNNNDAVSLAYSPAPFDGKIVLFQATKEYAIYKRAGLDLANIALQGASVHRLPVYPAGMLVEPFVDRLAAELQTALNHLSNGETFL